MKALFAILSAALALSSCIPEDVQSDELLAVVEAYLAPNQLITMKITREVAFGSTDTHLVYLDTLHVWFSDGTTSQQLAFGEDSLYHGDLPIVAGGTYSMWFVYEGDTITSVATVPAKPTGYTQSATSIEVPDFSNPGSGTMPTRPDPITLDWEQLDSLYYLVVVENMEADPDPINDDDDNLRPVFRGKPEKTNTYEIDFRNFSYYGQHRVILYSLQAEYAALYDNNGTTSQNLSTPASNVINGLGIFTGINADTLFVKASQP